MPFRLRVRNLLLRCFAVLKRTTAHRQKCTYFLSYIYMEYLSSEAFSISVVILLAMLCLYVEVKITNYEARINTVLFSR